MKQLIKLDSDYHVIDTKAEIKRGDTYIHGGEILHAIDIIKRESGNNSIVYQKSKGVIARCKNFDSYLIIASTNLELDVPLIQNIADCLDLIYKEVDIIFYPNFKKSPAAFEYNTGKDVALVIPKIIIVNHLAQLKLPK